MNLRRTIVGGLVCLVLGVSSIQRLESSAGESEQDETTQMKTSVLKFRNGKTEDYWFLEHDSATSHFLKKGEVYALRGTFPGKQSAGKNAYILGNKFVSSTNTYLLKNNGKLQPHSSGASFTIDINYEANPGRNEYRMNYTISGNGEFREMCDDLDVQFESCLGLVLNGVSKIKEAKVTLDEGWINENGVFVRKISTDGGNLELRVGPNNKSEVTSFEGKLLYTLGPIDDDVSQAKRASQELAKEYLDEKKK